MGMKKYIKEFIEACVNSNNTKVLCVIALLTLLFTNSLLKTLMSIGIYVIVLIIIWLIIRWKKKS